jgi:hypothetical protein
MNTIIENEDGTIIIDGRVYQEVKPIAAAAANTKEAVLLLLMKGLHSMQDRKNYPNSGFWFKDGTYMFEYDEKEKYFWCSYLHVWSVFEKDFAMEYEEIESFLRTWLEQYFKRRGTKANFASARFSVTVEKHFNGV